MGLFNFLKYVLNTFKIKGAYARYCSLSLIKVCISRDASFRIFMGEELEMLLDVLLGLPLLPKPVKQPETLVKSL
jgi:hypothetical protein